MKAQQQTFSIWVGDLPIGTTESQLYDFFKECGNIVSTHVKQPTANKTKSFGFVNFGTRQSFSKSLLQNKMPFMNSGHNVVIKPRNNNPGPDGNPLKFTKVFLGNVGCSSGDELRAGLAEKGNWKIDTIQMRPGTKWAFLFFGSVKEATRFCDDIKEGLFMFGMDLTAEIALDRKDRELMSLGITKEELERSRRTVVIKGLAQQITRHHVKDFCSEHGMVVCSNIEEPGIAIVEFKRKGVADTFAEKYALPHHADNINGSAGFIAVKYTFAAEEAQKSMQLLNAAAAAQAAQPQLCAFYDQYGQIQYGYQQQQQQQQQPVAPQAYAPPAYGMQQQAYQQRQVQYPAQAIGYAPNPQAAANSNPQAIGAQFQQMAAYQQQQQQMNPGFNVQAAGQAQNFAAAPVPGYQPAAAPQTQQRFQPY